jgi:hypothetical protein
MVRIELRVLPLAPFRVRRLIPFVVSPRFLTSAFTFALLLLVSVSGILLVGVLLVTHGILRIEARPNWPVSKHFWQHLIAKTTPAGLSRPVSKAVGKVKNNGPELLA